MSTLLLIPAFILGFPMMIGVWLAAVQLFKLSTGYTSKKTAFIVTLCVMAAVLSLLTAPIWLLGWKAYAIVCAVYVVFVGVGAPHVYRTLRFLGLELDGDPTNDVPLPGDEPNATTQTHTDDSAKKD